MQSQPVVRPTEGITPLGALARGAMAGLVATFVLSALSRISPGLWDRAEAPPPGTRPLPEDPENAEQVRQWQAASQAPAAYREEDSLSALDLRTGPSVTPYRALVIPRSPGPEGIAEQFAFKLASGMFGRDLTPLVRQAGLTVHLVYGSLWGAAFGLVQASEHFRTRRIGPLFGMIVYGVGPGWLVPAMRLMQPPTREPRERTAMLLVGHLVYGQTVASVYRALEERRNQHHTDQ